MPSNEHPAPRQYAGIMVSSTFTDLVQHRMALVKAIKGQGLTDIAMENDSAKPDVDVIDSSLQMVRDASAYIGVISRKYGQTPVCPKRNPHKLSITELEFNEAQRLERPILLFIMGDKHPLCEADVEINAAKRKKLKAFRERAKRMKPNSSVHRVYAIFDSVEGFTSKAIQAIAGLRRYLDDERSKFSPPEPPTATADPAVTATGRDPIPIQPAFYAEPPYIGSHNFVGRQAQLETLSDWASPADVHPVLLFEAIGGTGKSILTWEWTTKHAPRVRDDWAGRFWYSFYEKGATMVDFCRRALAYMTRQPRAVFGEKNTTELTEPLMHQLQAAPWLLILDGLERVLVSYHRFDAAQLRDEEAGSSDKIAHRDPCAAINPEDDDLLRALAGSRPSKLLLTSRLIPRVLLNNSNQPIPGVLREHLPGLRPTDAESLIRACGVTGTSLSIQNYLKSECDCHPLVVGVLAGLINDYFPDKGNFDAWVIDPVAGAQLNLAELDLVQKRNHILNAALAALPEKSRQLLSTLALLSGSVDYPTLCALNPSLPPIPEEISLPKHAEHGAIRYGMSEREKEEAREDDREALQRREEYEQALAKRAKEMRASSHELAFTVKDLERRALLQYDPLAKRYDLHPVVRGISAGGLKQEEKNLYGQRVVDHFSQQAQDPYEQADSLEDFDNARHIVKVLFQMGKLEQARRFIANNTFIQALNHRFEAHNEILTIIRPFFPAGWTEMPNYLEKKGGLFLAKRAAVALRRIAALQDAFDISQTALKVILKRNVADGLYSQLLTIASTVGEQNHLALEDRLLCLATELASLQETNNNVDTLRLARFRQLSRIGRWSDALSVWAELSPSELLPDGGAIAAHHYALYLFFRDRLTERKLAKAEDLNRNSKSALGRRNLCALRGFWLLEHRDFESAKKSLQDAVALAHEVGKIDRRSEIRLALAKYELKELAEPIQAAEKFTRSLEESCHRALADLWFAIGNHEQAKYHGVAAYKWAWGDGEPYVHRYELNKARALLNRLGTEIPELPNYDPSKDEKLPWEAQVGVVIQQSRVKNEIEAGESD